MKQLVLCLLFASTPLIASKQTPSLQTNQQSLSERLFGEEKIEVTPANDVEAEENNEEFQLYREQWAAHEATKARCCYIKGGCCLVGVIAILILLNRYAR